MSFDVCTIHIQIMHPTDRDAHAKKELIQKLKEGYDIVSQFSTINHGATQRVEYILRKEIPIYSSQITFT